MSIDKLIKDLTPAVYENMKTAIETGKWPNGVVLNKEQKANCLQIVIAYDNLHKDTEERVGYLPTKPEDAPSRRESDHSRPIRILED